MSTTWRRPGKAARYASSGQRRGKQKRSALAAGSEMSKSAEGGTRTISRQKQRWRSTPGSAAGDGSRSTATT
eukprot:343469-Prorocentrum_minimum.AAC.1